MNKRYAAAVFLFAFSSLAFSSVSGPDIDGNGSYTISATNDGMGPSCPIYLWEGGAQIAFGPSPLTYNVSGKVDGTYKYQTLVDGPPGQCNGHYKVQYGNTHTVIVARKPGIPSSISSPAKDSNGSFTISWGASSGNVSKYQLYQKKGSGSWNRIYSGTSRSKSVSGLGDGTYSFRVRACNTVSTYTTCSSYKKSGSTIVANKPSAPSSISAPTSDNNGAFTTSWGTSSGNVDKYELYQKKNSGSWSRIYTGSNRSRSVSGLGDGTYYYRVRACNTVSTYTACGGYKTSGGVTVANKPARPSSISGVPSTNATGSFTISWGASSGSVDKYQLYQQKGDGSWSLIYNGTGRSKTVGELGDGVYAYRVRACNTYSTYTACSGYRTSGTVIVANAPSAPDSISGVPPTDDDGAFTVSWTVPNGAVDDYQLEQQQGGGNWVPIYRGGVTSAPVSGLEDGVYRFRVRACNTVSTYTSCGDYRVSSDVIVAVPPAIPGSFSGLPSSDSDGSFDFAWGSVAGADTYELKRKKDGGSWIDVGDVPEAVYAVSGLTEGSYSFRVRACNTVSTFKSCSSHRTSSSVLVIYPPSIPASITAPVKAGSFTISWPASTGTVTRYTLQEKVDTGAWIAKQDIDTLSYVASGVAGGKNYTYRVRACNDYYCSEYRTGTATYAPYPPPVISLFVDDVNLGADGKYPIGWDGIYTVAWDISGQLSDYTLEESEDGESWQEIANSGGNIDFSKPPNYGPGNKDYYYRMQACNADGCSDWKMMTASVAPYPIPGGPGNISLSEGPAANGSYTLAWGASSGPVVTHYALQERPLSGSWGEEEDVGDTLQHSIEGRSSGDTYEYRVKACNTDQACSNYSDIFEVYIPYDAPAAPSNLTVDSQPTSSGNFTLSWTASTGYVETYEVEHRHEGGSWELLQDNSALNFAVSGAASGVNEYRIRACNPDACSAYSDVITIYVPYPTPSAPESLEVVVAPTPQGELTLAWQASSGRVDGYSLERRYNGTGTWNEVQNSSSTTAEVTGASPGNSEYRVKACNVDACSAYSTVLAVYVPYPAPTVPTGLQAIGAISSAGNFTLEWLDSSGSIEYYIVEHRASGGSWLQVASPTSTEKTISGAPSGSNDYRVKACNSDNCSEYSTVLAIYVPYPPPSTPSGLNVTSEPTTGGDLTFAWTASTGKVDYYIVEHRYGSSGSWNQVQSSAATTISITGINSGNSQYRIKACNSDACSSYSTTLDVYVPYPAPGIPGNIRIADGPDADGYLTLAWDISTGKVDNYVLERSFEGEPWSSVYTGSKLSTEVSSPQSGGYAFRVKACNRDNCSDYSDVMELDISVFTPQSSTVIYEYDALGRLIKTVDDVRGTHDYNYDKAGNRKSVVK